jgi:hypothetical protein
VGHPGHTPLPRQAARPSRVPALQRPPLAPLSDLFQPRGSKRSSCVESPSGLLHNLRISAHYNRSQLFVFISS